MRKFLLLLLLFPFSIFAADGSEDFRIYKKPLLPGIEIAQTDTHTELLYQWVVIKRYVNAEFSTELLTHSPDEDPDCYNSLQNQTPSTRAKNIIGKEYLRSCLVLQTKLVRDRFILFYGPSVDGNRVSIYDIRIRKFAHAAINNASQDVRFVLGGGLVFLTKNIGSACQHSIVLYKNNISRTLFDECSIQKEWGTLMHIDSYRLLPRKIIIKYTPYITQSSGDIMLDPSRKSQKIIQF